MEAIYADAADGFLFAYFDRYTLIVYLAFAACMLMLQNVHKNTSLPDAGDGDGSSGMLILPVAVLGAFLYHAVFEAKAQYSLIYLPMLLPYAAHALRRLGCARRRP